MINESYLCLVIQSPFIMENHTLATSALCKIEEDFKFIQESGVVVFTHVKLMINV